MRPRERPAPDREPSPPLPSPQFRFEQQIAMVRYRDFREPAPALEDASILVTGGTGSFGKSFVQYVMRTKPPRRLVVFSRDEQKQDVMSRELQATLPPERFDRLRFFIGDVRDAS